MGVFPMVMTYGADAGGALAGSAVAAVVKTALRVRLAASHGADGIRRRLSSSVGPRHVANGVPGRRAARPGMSVSFHRISWQRDRVT